MNENKPNKINHKQASCIYTEYRHHFIIMVMATTLNKIISTSPNFTHNPLCLPPQLALVYTPQVCANCSVFSRLGHEAAGVYRGLEMAPGRRRSG